MQSAAWFRLVQRSEGQVDPTIDSGLHGPMNDNEGRKVGRHEAIARWLVLALQGAAALLNLWQNLDRML